MKTSCRWLFLFSLLFTPLAAQTGPTNAARDARAQKATEQRMAYAASAEYNPYNTKVGDIRKAAFDFLGKDKFPEAIAEAQKGLALAKYNIDLLIILASAYRKAGDIAKADQVREQWMSLMDSILRSGKGRDFATAFKVITVDEEYAVLQVMRLEVVHQSLAGHEGSEFDVMEVKDTQTGATATLYFNVDLPKKWLNKQLAPAK